MSDNEHAQTIAKIYEALASMNDELIVKDPIEKISYDELILEHEMPNKVGTLFVEFLADWIRLTKLTAGEEHVKVIQARTYRGILRDERVWCLSISYSDSPFNPSGYDIVIRDDASFIGYFES